MKKKTVFLLGLLLGSMAGHAQLVVNSNGSVEAGTSSTASTRMIVGATPTQNPSGLGQTSSDQRALQSCLTTLNSGVSAGVYGASSPTSTGNIVCTGSIGVIGVASGAGHGRNFGIVGATSLKYGAAVLGTASGTVPNISNGYYAGYFNGNVYVNGTLTATTVTSPSDIRLKENIEPLCDSGRGETALGQLMAMNVLKYNYKRQEVESEPSLSGFIGVDEAAMRAEAEAAADEAAKKLHFGLSAQELQQIYPNLVEEGDNGYLSVNYMELVPVLIRCIQELKQEVDELRGTEVGGARKSLGTAAGIENGEASRSQLLQNTPNPARSETVIRYHLSSDARNAFICIYDMQGKQLRQIPVSKESDYITIAAHEFGAGMFLYSLIVNNQEVDTKRMILSK